MQHLHYKYKYVLIVIYMKYIQLIKKGHGTGADLVWDDICGLGSQALLFQPMPAIILWQWHHSTSNDCDITPNVTHHNWISGCQLTASSVSADARNYPMTTMPVMTPWYWCCGDSNDGNAMPIIYMGQTLKLDMQVLIDSLFCFRQHQQLSHDNDSGNDAVVPMLGC